MRVLRSLVPAAAVLWLVAVVCSSAAAQVSVRRDVVYGVAGGQGLKMDVYSHPPGPALRPALLVVHGGGWSGGDKREFVQAGALAQMGFVVFNANYRLVTAHGNRWPAQLDDVRLAVRFVRGNARRYGIDPRRVGALGVSAGGHLVTFLGTTDAPGPASDPHRRRSSKVDCVVDVSGPSDLTKPLPVKGPLDVEKLVANLIGKPRSRASGDYRRASPLFAVNRAAVPFLIVHGKADRVVPVEQSRRLHQALRKAGVKSTYVECVGDHDFALPQDQATLVRSVTTFLQAQLRPPRIGPGTRPVARPKR